MQQLDSNDYSHVCISHASQLLPEQIARQAIWHVCFKINSTKCTYPYSKLTILHVQTRFGLSDSKPRIYPEVFKRAHAVPSSSTRLSVTRQLFCYSGPLVFAYRARWHTHLYCRDTRSNPG